MGRIVGKITAGAGIWIRYLNMSIADKKEKMPTNTKWFFIQYSEAFFFLFNYMSLEE